MLPGANGERRGFLRKEQLGAGWHDLCNELRVFALSAMLTPGLAFGGNGVRATIANSGTVSRIGASGLRNQDRIGLCRQYGRQRVRLGLRLDWHSAEDANRCLISAISVCRDGLIRDARAKTPEPRMLKSHPVVKCGPQMCCMLAY